MIIPSYKPAYVYGGTIVVIAMLAEELSRQGHDVEVYTTTANGKSELGITPGSTINLDGVRVTYFKRITGDHTHISLTLWKHLFLKVKTFDIVHIHSWWSPLIIGASLMCKLRNVKPMFSPHGMLSNYIIETNNGKKKKWLHKIAGLYLLKNSYLHVTAATEWRECLKIIPTWEGCIIPNLVKLPLENHGRRRNEIFTIGFLSRIDPKKGLDILITALADANFDFRLLVAGEGDEIYVTKLKEMSKNLNISHKIQWLGWKTGEEKFKFLSELDLFALTSHNENFAIVVIEALSVGTPVVISNKVGLYKYIEEKSYGWITSLEMKNVIGKLNESYRDTQKHQSVNLTAAEEIKKEFNDTLLANQYLKMYKTFGKLSPTEIENHYEDDRC